VIQAKNWLVEAGAYPGEWFWGSKPLPFGSKAMLLMANIVKQLSNDSVHSGSNQTLKKKVVKLATSVCLLYQNPPL